MWRGEQGLGWSDPPDRSWWPGLGRRQLGQKERGRSECWLRSGTARPGLGLRGKGAVRAREEEQGDLGIQLRCWGCHWEADVEGASLPEQIQNSDVLSLRFLFGMKGRWPRGDGHSGLLVIHSLVHLCILPLKYIS